MSRALSQSADATTILAVDDDRAVLGLVQAVLQSAGYSVLLADGGRSAIEVFDSATRPVHLLLTDVIMPDLTGPVVAERLRAKQPDLHVLFMSGFHDADLVQRFVTDQGFNLLAKPFTVESLLRGVQNVLTLRAGG
jgi:two-component system, cell cycle sensor histidine kinase and response regulator CckA